MANKRRPPAVGTRAGRKNFDLDGSNAQADSPEPLDPQVALAGVVEATPELGVFGFQTYGRRNPPRTFFENERRDLAAQTAEFAAAVRWVTRHRPQRSGARIHQYSSYFLKHLCETDEELYVANGVLIAAAIAVGLPIIRIDVQSPNASIGVGCSLRARAWQKRSM